jgi:hypothetical protein
MVGNFGSASDYLAEEFVDVTDPMVRLSTYSSGYQKHVRRVMAIFDSFRNRFQDRSITVTQIVSFMCYRVTGDVDFSEDAFTATCSLPTWMSTDFGPLMTGLREHNMTTLTNNDILSSPEYKSAKAWIVRYQQERASHSHARIIWFQDEARLMECLTCDTASKRDRAFLVIGLRSGFRAESVLSIRLDRDILREGDTVIILIPEVKTGCRRSFELQLTGDDAVIVSSWLQHRRALAAPTKFLFITKQGTKMTCDHASQMLRRLSQCAGYGFGFFTVHSLRMSWVNRTAARVFSEGGTLTDVRETICDGLRWSQKSDVALQYTNLLGSSTVRTRIVINDLINNNIKLEKLG